MAQNLTHYHFFPFSLLAFSTGCGRVYLRSVFSGVVVAVFFLFFFVILFFFNYLRWKIEGAAERGRTPEIEPNLRPNESVLKCSC